MNDSTDICVSSKKLKQELLDFVLEADDDVAIALEKFSADQLTQWSNVNYHDANQSALVIDMFLTEGDIKGQTPIDIFLDSNQDLSEGDRHLLATWNHSFNGLFEVIDATPEGFECVNWLTDKRYLIRHNGLQDQAKLARLSPNEIVVARISPLTDTDWIWSGPIQLLGKLGKPKLAVAIGNFKNRFKKHLYGDAPELLEESWRSVERYHQEFIDFFNTNEVTLPGHQLDKKLKEFQDLVTQRRLENSGIDSSKSLSEIAEEAGVSQTDVTETAADLGTDDATVNQLFDSKKSVKMVMPKVDLPEILRKAPEVTVIVHPRWGQSFLTDYRQLTTLLESAGESANNPETEALDVLVKRYLENDATNPYVWRRLAQQHPGQLETALRRVLNRPDFDLAKDLDPVLESFGKLEPELPDIASAPIHLHNLFQDALLNVNKNKSKSKTKASKGRQKSGFGA
ncbi:MAG TPA: hypothetical protein ACFE0H_01705 [Elainellaceae cyanobacterium]